ncbi:chaperonin 10-like protein [Aspergillus pseudoustus]|uniref:Chaperonin 10-like protein n=1 Tax=Aspergillus pseudoustus TaxID=1810923 RepID=A0ABR4JPL1_9EURO
MAFTDGTTQALVAYEPKNGRPDIRLEEVELRKLADDELLVCIVAVGVCHTDLLFATWPADQIPYPRVLGHEGSGIVQQAGSRVSRASIGDSVLLSFRSCAACKTCKDDHPSFCDQFAALNYAGELNAYTATDSGKQRVHGGFFGQSSFARVAIVKESSVVNVSGLVRGEDELKLLAPLGCGFQTGIGTVENVASAGPEDAVVVLGLGGVGLAAIMAAKLKGCKTIIGVDRLPGRLALAEALGATGVIDTVNKGVEIGEEVKKLNNNDGPSVTIDTTGNMDLIRGAVQWTANRGQIIIVGVPPPDALFNLHLIEFMQTGKVIRGSIEGDADPSKYVPRMIKWYREGKLPFEKLVKFYPVTMSPRSSSGKVQ